MSKQQVHRRVSDKGQERDGKLRSKHDETPPPHAAPGDHHMNASDIFRLLLNENPFITSGHRRHTENDYIECFKSIFSIHNDTFNIWTHLCSAIYLFYIMYIMHSPSSVSALAPFWDKFVISFFVVCTAVCFLFSAAYHAFRSHSVDAYKRFLVLDVSSIGLQLFSCNVVTMYFEMACYPDLRTRYHVTLVLLMVVIVSSVPWMMRGGRTSLRTFSFIVLACSGLVAHFHHAFTRGWMWNPVEQHVCLYLLLTYIFSAIGLIVRRVRFPESLFVGHFHIYFSSHQIFHVLVSLASFSMHKAYSPFLMKPYVCPVM